MQLQCLYFSGVSTCSPTHNSNGTKKLHNNFFWFSAKCFLIFSFGKKCNFGASLARTPPNHRVALTIIYKLGMFGRGHSC